MTAPADVRSPTSAPDTSAGRARLAVVALGAALTALSGPGQTAGFSVFVDPITDAFGVSRGQLTTAYLVATLAAAPTGLWLGRFLDRRRLATMIRVVGAALALSLVLAAVSPGLGVLAVGVFGLRAFGQTGLTLTASVFVARAVTVRRGAALGWLSAIGGFAISLTPLGASRLIPALGWRWTWVALAGVVLVGTNLLALAGRRLAPAPAVPATRSSVHAAPVVPLVAPPVPVDDERAGDERVDDERVDDERAGDERVDDERVDGDRGAPGAAAAGPGQPGDDPDATGAIDPRQRRWAFTVVTASGATTGAIGTALGFHQVAVLGERGLSAAAAAANFLPQSAAAATTAVLVGRLVDRVPGRLVVPGVMVLTAVALGALHLVTSPVTAVAFGVLLGAAVASNQASEAALLTRWTGTRTLGRLRGRSLAVAVASTAVAPLAFTLLADVTGSFSRAATFSIALPAVVAVLAWRAPLPADRRDELDEGVAVSGRDDLPGVGRSSA